MKQTMYRTVMFFLCMLTLGAYGQKESKTYKETFNVDADAVVNINTSHADIEFETWDKNQIVIEGIIELEGATEEEMEAYFRDSPIKIMGNSKNIEVSTNEENSWFVSNTMGNLSDFVVEVPNVEHLLMNIPPMPDFPEMPELAVMAPMPPMPPLSPMPPIPMIDMQDFDYDAYKEDGDAYLKKWKKEFDKNFDEKYQKELAQWSKEMEARKEEMEAHQEQMKEERRMAIEEQKQAMREQKEALKEQREAIKEQQKMQRNLFISRDGDGVAPDVFYFSSDGKERNFKIKKTIKIKMPKSTKLKMNVRHGEVKLAENTKNINATLSYARLLATNIDGDNTVINASYSPVSVEKWTLGKLKADYSDKVDLKEVKELKLTAIASNVTIDRLLQNAWVDNDLGIMKINSISNSFKELSINVEHGELICNLPTSPYTIVISTNKDSKFICPDGLKLEKTSDFDALVYKGYHINKNNDRSITVNSDYSKVVLK